jgi:hypothetical protein
MHASRGAFFDLSVIQNERQESFGQKEVKMQNGVCPARVDDCTGRTPWAITETAAMRLSRCVA